MPTSGKSRQPQKANRTTWRKGQSGNPAGRAPVAAEVIQFARERSLPAMQRLDRLTRSRNLAVAVRACEALLDRAWGRAPSTVELAGAGGGPVRIREEQPVTPETVAEFRRVLMERAVGSVAAALVVAQPANGTNGTNGNGRPRSNGNGSSH